MTETRYDVLGLGNAIVDVIARTDDDFLATHHLNKGSMTLIEESRAEALFQAMGPAEIVSGGCAARPSSARFGRTRWASFSPRTSVPSASISRRNPRARGRRRQGPSSWSPRMASAP
jgi:hypothetical protein